MARKLSAYLSRCGHVVREYYRIVFPNSIQITHTYSSKRKESGKLRRLSLAISLLAILTHLALAGRYYDARTGRFLQIDPQAEKYPGVSSYGYALNNPLKYIDPTGEWVAQYDANNKAVTVQAEEGDDLKSLYSQMGMSETKFADYYGFKDMSDFKVVGGQTTFDVTQLVTPYTDYDPSADESKNCHGFVAAAVFNKTPERGMGDVGAISLRELLSSTASVNSPQTGDIAVFTMEGSLGSGGNAQDFTGRAGHSAVFVITNAAGEPQFLNRLNTGLPVGISTQSEIRAFFSNESARLKINWGNSPVLSGTPDYNRMK
jgi:hypothetical protein